VVLHWCYKIVTRDCAGLTLVLQKGGTKSLITLITNVVFHKTVELLCTQVSTKGVNKDVIRFIRGVTKGVTRCGTHRSLSPGAC
jgi:hypothetical protein